jgi:hypothetical protein
MCSLTGCEAEVVTDKQAWERARLNPVSGITGADEQERRGVSALLAVINSVREFGRAITAPLGAPAGTPMAYIDVEVDLDDGDGRAGALVAGEVHMRRPASGKPEPGP